MRKQKGPISGIHRKPELAEVKHEGIRVMLNMDEILDCIDPEVLMSLSPRKSFSVIMPEGISKEHALELLRRDSFVIEDYPNEVWLRIIPQ